MEKKIFVIIMIFGLLFSSNVLTIAKAAGSQNSAEYNVNEGKKSTKNVKDNSNNKKEDSVGTYALPDTFKAIVIVAIATAVIDQIVTQLWSSASNWLKDHFRETGAVENPDTSCSQVKMGGITITHTDRTNWVGDGLTNKYANVKALQKELIKAGYNPGVADGYWGSKTKTAVKQAQYDKGLVADGVVGTKTWARFGGAKRSCYQ